MATTSASDQSRGHQNHVKNIIVVGATGTVGTHIVRALLSEGKHAVTALTRPDSTSTLPAGLAAVKRAAYTSHKDLVEAMADQDALIITMNRTAAPDTQQRLIDAAIEAGVKYVMPNEYAHDMSNEAIKEGSGIATKIIETRKYVEEHGEGKTHWIALSCSFWYEWSLAGYDVRFGFDFPTKTLTLFDDGETRISTTTLPLCGLAVARLFALRILPESEKDQTPTLSSLQNTAVLVNSFAITQKDMFASVLRVTGEKESDWTIERETSHDRRHRGQELLKQGDLNGMIIEMYTRTFIRDGGGDFSHKAMNDVLDLPHESLDDWTKVAIQMNERQEVRKVPRPQQ